MANEIWETLADAYEVSSTREDSLDRLLEYPAQRQAIGDVSGKSILDLGCGSGRKALDFINAGADKVVGIDISSRFVDAWRSRDQPKNLKSQHPTKAEWLAKYAGTIVYELTAASTRNANEDNR